MYASPAIVFTALAALARVAVATPPACLLAALMPQPDPSDLKALCGTLQGAVAGNITEKCSGDAESAAISAYSATCLSSESVTISITTSAASSSKTGTASAKITGTGAASGSSGTATAKATGSGSGTATSTNASSTGNSAGSNTPQIAMAVLAAGLAGQYFL